MICAQVQNVHEIVQNINLFNLDNLKILACGLFVGLVDYFVGLLCYLLALWAICWAFVLFVGLVGYLMGFLWICWALGYLLGLWAIYWV